MRHAERLSAEMQRCINECMECHAMCEETLTYCLQLSGMHAEPRRMTMLMDCSEMTRMCAGMMMRMSEMCADMCAMCARMCDMCADACATMGDDRQVMMCADMCRRTAETCRVMAGTKA